MSTPDPGRMPSDTDESSTVPSTIPRRLPPPKSGRGMSSPPLTPHPLLGRQESSTLPSTVPPPPLTPHPLRGREATKSNFPKKSVRFSEKSQMKFYQPEQRSQDHQSSRAGRGGGQLGGRPSFLSSQTEPEPETGTGSSNQEVSTGGGGGGQVEVQDGSGPTFSRFLDNFNYTKASSASAFATASMAR